MTSVSDLEVALLWQLRAVGVRQPERQYRFEPTRRWRFDFAWPDVKVAVEVDGGTWVAGRHTRGSGFESDAEKLNAAALAGWLVIRLTGKMVDDGRGVSYIEKALHMRR